jgi:hypothetical protein
MFVYLSTDTLAPCVAITTSTTTTTTGNAAVA